MVMKTVLNVKMGSAMKRDLVKNAKEIGLPVSTVVSNLVERFNEEKQLTFQAPLKPSKRLIASIRQGMKDMQAGNMSPLFVNMNKMDRYLRSL